MFSRLLPALSLLAASPAFAQTQAPPTIRPTPPPVYPVPPPIPRAPPPFVTAPPGEQWPPRAMIRPLTPPDVSDADNYPAAARRNEEEGLVVFELLVARNGAPRACRIYRSSGFAALDGGTCDLGTRLRFAPQTAEVTFRGQIMWQLAPHPVPLVASEAQIDLTMKDGRAAGCMARGAGPLFPMWRRTACLMVGAERRYYFGDRNADDGSIRVFVRLFPIGADLAAGSPPADRPAASQRIEFELDRKGAIRRCRTVRSRGFGPLRVDGRYPCGNFFLSQAWFDKARDDQPARTGAIEVEVYPTELR